MYRYYVQTLSSEEEKYQQQIDRYFSGMLGEGDPEP